MLRAPFCNLDTKCLHRQVNVRMLICADITLDHSQCLAFHTPPFFGEKNATASTSRCRCINFLCILPQGHFQLISSIHISCHRSGTCSPWRSSEFLAYCFFLCFSLGFSFLRTFATAATIISISPHRWLHLCLVWAVSLKVLVGTVVGASQTAI